MLSNEEIKSLANKEQDGEVVGYVYYRKEGYIFPIFTLPDDPHDAPTSGGGFYIDEKDKSVNFMTLLDMLDLSNSEEPVYFEET